jgi:hypothetical protein
MAHKAHRGLTKNNAVNGRVRKTERREQSLARKAEFDKLSLKEKLARLPEGGANRQRARYLALLAKQEEAKKEGEKQKRKKERTQEAAAQYAEQLKG